MDKILEIDQTDLAILRIMMHNADLSYAEIGKRVFVSGGTVHVRVSKMKQMGIIRGSRLDIDVSKLGWDITSYLGIYLDKSSL
ncbi:MAG: winged helix-turn-helix transcriptional regulator, partial [Spirosomataceae bacterium]